MIFNILFVFNLWITTLYAHPLQVLSLNADLVCIGPGCLFAESPHGTERAEKIGKWIQKQNPDIVLLQEIWQPLQYEMILKYSKMPYGFYPGKPSEMAILSKYPLSESQLIPLIWSGGSQLLHAKVIAAGYRSGLISTSIQFKKNQSVVLGNVHIIPRDISISGFASPADAASDERKLALIYIHEQLQLIAKNRPIILGGDFNMNQQSVEYAFHFNSGLWTDHYRNATTPELWLNECTFCTENPFVKAQTQPGEGILDYIFSSQDCTTPQKAQILKETDAFSDHRAIVATINIIDDQPCTYPKINRYPKKEIETILRHIQKVPLLFLSFVGGQDIWTQRKNSIKYLQHQINLSTNTTQKGSDAIK